MQGIGLFEARLSTVLPPACGEFRVVGVAIAGIGGPASAVGSVLAAAVDQEIVKKKSVTGLKIDCDRLFIQCAVLKVGEPHKPIVGFDLDRVIGAMAAGD